MNRIRKITLGLLAAVAITASSVAFIPAAHAGWVDAYGIYHCTWHPVFLGYNVFGAPIFGPPVCN